MRSNATATVTIVLVLALTVVVGAQPALDTNDSRQIVAGRTAVYHSRLLDSDLKLSIRLPSDYVQTSARYPVLFTLRSFDLAVGIVNTMCSGDYIPDMIVISIEGIGSDLYLPSPSSDGYGGGAERLLHVIRDELIPVVDSTYRTEAYRIMFGSSWAGMFAVYAALTSPQTINAAVASGPWITYDGDQRFVVSQVSDWIAGQDYSHSYLYFTGGNQPEIVPPLEEFNSLLKTASVKGLRCIYDPMPEEDHYSLGPRTLLTGLRRLFASRRELPDSVVAGGETTISAYVAQVNAQFGYDIGLNPAALSSRGWELLEAGDTLRAVQVMELGAQLNPESANAFYALGRLLQLTGDLEAAKVNYEKAVSLLTPSQTVLRGIYEHMLREVSDLLEANKQGR